jgi:hypothetical protein
MTIPNRQASARLFQLIHSTRKHLKVHSLPLRLCVSAVAFLLLTLWATDAVSQTFPTPDYFRRVWSAQAIPETIAGPEKLRDYVISGRLRLTLEDAIRLTLLNNTEVKLNQLQYEGIKYSVLRAYCRSSAMSSFRHARNNSHHFAARRRSDTQQPKPGLLP